MMRTGNRAGRPMVGMLVGSRGDNSNTSKTRRFARSSRVRIVSCALAAVVVVVFACAMAPAFLSGVPGWGSASQGSPSGASAQADSAAFTPDDASTLGGPAGNDALADGALGGEDEVGSSAPKPEEPSAAAIAANAANAARMADRVQATEADMSADHESGVVLVQLASDASPAILNATLAQTGFIADPAISEEDVENGFAELRVADGRDLAQAMAVASAVEGVEYSQPNYVYHLLDGDVTGQEATVFGATSPDAASLEAAMLPQATHVNDERASEQWALDSVHAPEAWDMEKADHRVAVAVLDTGCKADHEDLNDNIVARYDATLKKTGVNDPWGHGTHVCGIIAAEANNAVGVAGVSYNADIVSIQVFAQEGDKEPGASSLDLARAYAWLIDNADAYSIKVVNMSLGAEVDDAGKLDGDDRLLFTRIKSAYDAGILTVCAAGNDAGAEEGAYDNFPSDFVENAIGVIALEKGSAGSSPKRSSYSNYNTSPEQRTKDLSAPGTDVLSTTFDGSYGNKSGTSMASPCVAGIAALVYAVNPDLEPAEVRDILHETATDLGPKGFDVEYGYGEVNAAAAVERAAAGHTRLEGYDAVIANQTIALAPSATPAGSWSWSSDNTDVATVDQAGVVTGKAAGTATITATAGTWTASKQITVFEASFTDVDGNPIAADGDTTHDPLTIELDAAAQVLFNLTPSLGSWNFTTSDESIAVVRCSSTGIYVAAKSAGEAVITATLESSPNVSASFKVKVVPSESKRSLSNADIGLADDSGDFFVQQLFFFTRYYAYYNGAPIHPSPIVLYYGGSATVELVEGVDYTVEYGDNTVEGTGTATVTGINGCEGSRSLSFQILKRPLNLSFVSFETPSVSYTGQALTPEPVLTTTTTGYRLVEGVDYEITEYGNNVNAGNAAYMRISGKNNVSGSGTLRFTIEPADIAQVGSATLSQTAYDYDGSAHEPAVKVVGRGGVDLVEGQDYIVSYASNVNAGAASSSRPPRAIVSGMGNYSGTIEVPFTIARVANPLTVTAKAGTKAKAVQLSYSKLAKKALTVKASKWLAKRGAAGAVTYKKTSASVTAVKAVTAKGANAKTRAKALKAAKKKAAKCTKYIKVNASTGRITMPKGAPKGLYTLKVAAKAAGTSNYFPATQAVIVKVRVK